MKKYHPADARYQTNTPAGAARPLRTYLSEREVNTAAITDPREERRALRQAQKDAHRDVQVNAPFWLRFVPFGAQWIDLKAEHARNAAVGKKWYYTAAQLFGALLLYIVLTRVFDAGVIAL